MTYDILILGAGPAGMTAAIYAARAGKTVCMIDCEGFGGQMGRSPKIENFPGFPAISGADLAMAMFTQVTELGVVLDLDEVQSITRTASGVHITTLASDYDAKVLIIATGAHPIELQVPGGTEYNGNGVYYCVACDGPLFKDKSVVVLGSGNSGAQYALDLSEYCSEVTICDITPTLCCEHMMASRILRSDIRQKLSARVTEIRKNDIGQMVLTFADDTQILTDGIFVAIGQSPSTECVKNFVDLDNKGYVITSGVETGVPGVYAAGDCRVRGVRQAITAAADGAEAALAAIAYLREESAN